MRKSVPTLLATGLTAVAIMGATGVATASTSAAADEPTARYASFSKIHHGKKCHKKGKVVRVGNQYHSVLFKCTKKGGKLVWQYNGGVQH